jgi:hypothetical protein
LFVELAAPDAADDLDVGVVMISLLAESKHEHDRDLLPREARKQTLCRPSFARLTPARLTGPRRPSAVAVAKARSSLVTTSCKSFLSARQAASCAELGLASALTRAWLICSVAYCEALSCRATSVEFQGNACGRGADGLVGGH